MTERRTHEWHQMHYSTSDTFAEHMNGASTCCDCVVSRLWSIERIQFIECIGMEVDGLKVEEAYFRGRKLHGSTIDLPQGYSGYTYFLLFSIFFDFN